MTTASGNSQLRFHLSTVLFSSHHHLLNYFQISLEWSVTFIKVSVWTCVLRLSTTARTGDVSRAQRTAGSAPAPTAATGVTPPTTALMVHVWSWSVEKVNKVTVLPKSFSLYVFFFFVTCRHSMSQVTLEKHCLTPALLPFSPSHLVSLAMHFPPSPNEFFGLRGGEGPRIWRLHGLWGRLQQVCTV